MTDDPREQFIEIFNRSKTQTCSLAGFKFTSGVRFTFPDISIGPEEYLVVCADEDRVRQLHGITNTVGNWDASTSLDMGGERIRLVNAAVPPVEVEDFTYDDRPPWPVLADGLGPSLERRSPHLDNDDPANWAASELPPAWTRHTVSGLVTSSALYLYLTSQGTAYIDELKLYPSANPAFNVIQNGGFESTVFSPWVATGNHTESGPSSENTFRGERSLKVVAEGAGRFSVASITQERLALSPGSPYTLEFHALLTRPGQALVCGLGDSSGVGSFKIEARSCPSTPGKRNTVFSEDLPPFIHPVAHEPRSPGPATDVLLLARVRDDAATRTVTAHWEDSTQVVTAEMQDDGAHGDGLARDGLHGVYIGRFPAGQVVRYWFTAKDSVGQETRCPSPGNPTQKLGFFVEPGGQRPSFQLRSNRGQASSKAPVYYLLVDEAHLEGDPPHLNESVTEYRPATFVCDGEVYDNVRVRHHGQTSLNSPKKKWRVNFNKDHRFLPPFENHPEVDVINIDGSYTDKTFLREWLSYKAFRDAGEASVESWHVRLYLNGAYRGLYLHVEEAGEKQWLSRVGLGKDGWLWKAYSDARGDTNAFELEVARYESSTRGFEALGSFLDRMNTLEGEALVEYILSNMNVESFLNYLAVTQLLHDCDSADHNYLIHAREKDPRGTWRFLAWDRDLTHGRNYECVPAIPGEPGILHAGGAGLYSDTIRYDMFKDPQLLFGTSVKPKCSSRAWNGVVDAFLLGTRFFQPEYRERIRELLEVLYNPGVLNPLIEAMARELSDEVALDWARTPPYEQRESYSYHVEKLKQYVEARYEYLSNVLDVLEVPDIKNLACHRSGGTASLSWENGANYTAIRLYRNGVIEWTLPGDATSAMVSLDSATGVTTTFQVASVVQGTQREGPTCEIRVVAPDVSQIPSSSFVASRRAGVVPFLVKFTDTSTGSESSVWEFGDGETSAELSPAHVYRKPGSYTVGLTTRGPGGSNKHTEVDHVIATEGVRAEFEATTLSGPAPLEVAFANQSRGASSHEWQFGDGSTSSSADPTHSYVSGGTYTVSLTATATDGTRDTRTRVQYVQVDGVLLPEFSASATRGLLPFSADFRDQSAGWVRAWLWSFGDGVTSTEQHPRHTYLRDGSYSVTLEVFGFATSAVRRKDNYIGASSGLEPFLRGNVNGDSQVDISDAIAILTFLFVGGVQLDCLDAADVDDRGTLEISDAVRLLTFLFLEGLPPEPPFPGRGVDSTPDSLTCIGG